MPIDYIGSPSTTQFPVGDPYPGMPMPPSDAALMAREMERYRRQQANQGFMSGMQYYEPNTRNPLDELALRMMPKSDMAMVLPMDGAATRNTASRQHALMADMRRNAELQRLLRRNGVIRSSAVGDYMHKLYGGEANPTFVPGPPASAEGMKRWMLMRPQVMPNPY